MRKLSDFVEMAATEYWQETCKDELAPLWIADFFQNCGVLDEHPNLNLVDFHALVQKALTVNIERAEKLAHLQQDRAGRSTKC
ncbi:MAG: hypothetical protein V1879_04690 [Pseudomonadota bacterium]